MKELVVGSPEAALEDKQPSAEMGCELTARRRLPTHLPLWCLGV